MNTKKSLRLKTALSSLEKQLTDGVKTSKGNGYIKEPLTEFDTNRVKKEINIIKSKLGLISKKPEVEFTTQKQPINITQL